MPFWSSQKVVNPPTPPEGVISMDPVLTVLQTTPVILSIVTSISASSVITTFTVSAQLLPSIE